MTRKLWILPAIGVAAFCTLVWFAGPQISISGQAPLAAPLARIAFALLFVLQYLMLTAWALWRARRNNAQLVNELMPVSAADEDSATAQLRQRFADALVALRRMRLGSRGGRSYLYQLPWYAIIGAPGTGKTTALLNAGLRFPLSQNQTKGPVGGFGGTRHCDWWFSETAVLLDTAGRYTTQDSDSGADANAWHAFLQLLRKTRPRLPLNGVLMAVSVSDLLAFNDSQLLEHARLLRQRLDELQTTLDIRPPVYLLITKCDLLPGFIDWFGAIDRSARDAVWGVTFDLPGSSPAHITAQFNAAFANLVERLADALLARLESEHDAQRRARLFSLPSQVRALSGRLSMLLTHAFDAAPSAGLAPKPLVRGVYLTSGTQEGTPIDRMLSALGRELGLQQYILPPNQNTGKSFFMTRLLSDVVFAEATLNGHALLRQRWQRQLLLASMLLLQLSALGIAIVWIDRYRRHVAEIDHFDSRVAHVQSALADVASSTDPDPRPLLPALDAMRALVGLTAQPELDAAVRATYERALLGAFQAKVVAAVDATLRHGSDVNLQYEALKTYAMLTDPAHFDAAGIKVFVVSYWNSALVPLASASERARLALHLDALLAAGAIGSGMRWDPVLVNSVRARLAAPSVAARIALRLEVLLEQAAPADITFDSLSATTLFAAGESAPGVMVAGRYTVKAYRDTVLPEASRIAAALAAEAPWVLGDASAQPAEEAADYLTIYRNEYANAWNRAITDLHLKPVADNQSALRQIQVLSEPKGPLAQWLTAVVNQTPSLLQNGAPGPIADSDPAAAPLLALRQLLNADATLADSLQRTLKHIQGLRTPSAAADLDGPVRSENLAAIITDARQQPPPIRSILLALAVIPPGVEPGPTSAAALSRLIAARLSVPCLQLVAGKFPFDRRATRDAPLRDFSRLFGATGAYAAVFRDLLASRVDTTGESWSARTPTGPDARDIERFRSAARIRSVFFAVNGSQPHLQMTFVPLEMDRDIDRFHLEIDGQVVNYAHGPALPTVVKWPGEHGGAKLGVSPTGNASLSEYTGPWALFRLFDHAAIKEGDIAGRFIIVFDVDGRHASFQVDTDLGANPFRLRELEHVDCPLPGT